MSITLAEATTSLLAILEPLSSEDRRRVVQAVLVLLGEEAPEKTPDKSARGKGHDEDGPELPPQARAWMQKHGLSVDTIGAFVHLEKGQVAVIELPGNSTSNRARTQASYLMAGCAALLTGGDPSFTDEQGRALCLHFGCHDPSNHASFVKSLGNKVIGSKSAGLKLTAPGLGAVAELIKSKAKADA